MQDQTPHDLAQALLSSLKQINPYHTKQEGQAWAMGFLVGYIAEQIARDPQEYKKWVRKLKALSSK